MSSTSKRLLILLGITTVAAGGYVAYRYYTKKKNEQQTDYISINNEPVEAVEEPGVEEVEQPEKFIFGDNISKMPEFTEIEKTEYSTRALAYAIERVMTRTTRLLLRSPKMLMTKRLLKL